MRMMPAVFAIDAAHGSTDYRRCSGENARIKCVATQTRAVAKETAMSAEAPPIKLSGWALILGASSGFGAATSLALARAGCHESRGRPQDQGPSGELDRWGLSAHGGLLGDSPRLRGHALDSSILPAAAAEVRATMCCVYGEDGRHHPHWQ